VVVRPPGRKTLLNDPQRLLSILGSRVTNCENQN